MPGTGPGGRYTMADIGYDDPILLDQLNGDFTVVNGRVYENSQKGLSGQPAVDYSYFGNNPYYNTPYVPLTAADLANQAAGLCDRLPPGYREACVAVAAAAGTLGNKSTPPLTSQQCSEGWTWSPTLKTCVRPGAALPGGDPMTLDRSVPTTGSLGLGALTPTQVGYITRKDGSTGPILKCPRRYVLGQDYLCYPKSMIPNQLRAHPRGTRPLLTGGEVKILRRAKSLGKKVGKLGRQFGPKTCHCGPAKGKKK